LEESIQKYNQDGILNRMVNQL